MDGLSVAASIIGVISLAMQLSQTTRRLIAFLDDVKGAPKEITRLNELLKLIFAMSAGVVNALEYQRRQLGDLAQGHEHLRDVLVICLRQLNSIRDTMDMAELSQQRGNLASKSWARLKLSLKMDEIFELERQLGQSLQVLNIALTTSLFFRSYKKASLPQHRSFVDESNSAALTITDPCRGIGSQDTTKMPRGCLTDGSDMHETRSNIVSLSTSNSHTSYYYWPGNIRISCDTTKTHRRHQYGSGKRDTETNSTKRLCRVALGFLSASIEFTARRLSTSSPVFSLRIRHLISTQTYRTHIVPMLKDGGVEEFLQLLDSGVCTINSVVDGWEDSILELAEWTGNSDIAGFLHSQGCDYDIGSIQHVLRSWASSSRFRTVIPKFDLADHCLDDIVPHHPAYEIAHLLDAVEWFTSTGVHMTVQAKEEYLGSLLCLLCTGWEAAVTAPLQRNRDSLVLVLIKNGANVHHLNNEGLTALRCLLRHNVLDADPTALSQWLTLLELGQIDLRHYLEMEYKLCPQPFETFWQYTRFIPPTYACFTPRRIATDVLETPMPNAPCSHGAAMLYLDPSSAAIQLLEEFNFMPSFYIQSGDQCRYMSYWLGLWKRDTKTNTQGRTIKQLLEQWVLATSTQTQAEREIWREAQNLPLRPHPNIKSFIDSRGLRSRGMAELAWATISLSIPCGFCECDVSGQYLGLWPFNGNTHTLCQTGNLIGRPCLNQSTWCPMHCCRFNHERFARKQEKKRLKQMKILGLKTKFYVPPVPGRWVD